MFTYLLRKRQGCFLFYNIFLAIGLLLLIGACGQVGPYPRMSVTTDFGKEVISSSCSAWNDGCNIYCRSSALKPEFMKYAEKDRCHEGDTARSRCIDNTYKKVLPEGWSRTKTKDNCIDRG